MVAANCRYMRKNNRDGPAIFTNRNPDPISNPIPNADLPLVILADRRSEDVDWQASETVLLEKKKYKYSII